MNSDDLTFFALVANAGSLSAAALASGLDTSTVSRRIAQLEKALGARLFLRSGRGMALSPKGQTLLLHARQVDLAMASARAAMAADTGKGPASIRIAAQPTIARALFGDLFHRVRARFPHSRIRFQEGLASGLLTDLQAGTIDVAVLYRPAHPGNLAYEPILLEKLYLLTPPDYPLTQDELQANGLADVPLILPSTHHGLRVLLEEIAARRGQAIHVAIESDSSNTIALQLVQKGCGCTVLPLAAASDEIVRGKLRAFSLSEPGCERCICLVLGRTALEPSDLWTLGDLIRNLACELADHGAWPGAKVLPASATPPKGAPVA